MKHYRSATSVAMLVVFTVLGCSQEPVPTSSKTVSDPSSSMVISKNFEELFALTRKASLIGGMPMDTLADKRAFIAAGQDIAIRVHKILGNEQEGLKMKGKGFIAQEQPRTLMRLFYLGADVATADGKPKDAAELCLDLTRLGTVIANSGGFADYDMGIACYNIAVEKLVPLCNMLDTATCIYLIQTLDRELAKLDDTETVVKRGESVQTSGQEKDDAGKAAADSKLLDIQSQAYLAREKICRTLCQLCRIKLALRVCYLHDGRFPRSLQELKYKKILDRLPKDYWHEDGFVYRLRDNDYALYSVGPNRQDNGGKQISRQELLGGTLGDIVL